jgi:hypothetical protein
MKMSDNKITKEQIECILEHSAHSDVKLGTKTTVLVVTLPNGFEIVESSSCVDPANYDHALGVDICKRRVVDKLWLLEGYRLQCDIFRRACDTALGKCSS